MNWSHPSSWFISFRCLFSLFCSRIDLAVPLKMSKLIFASGSLYLALLSFPQVIGSNVFWPPTNDAFLLLCCCLPPYLAPFFFIELTAAWNCVWTCTLTLPTPSLECCWKLRLCLLIAVLTGPDRSRKSVKVLWSEWMLAQDRKAFIKDWLEMFWRLVGFGS